MKAMAAILMFAGAVLAQDAPTPAPELTDAETAVLGGFAAEQVDASAASDALQTALTGKLEELRKAHAATTEKKDDSSTPRKGKKKKKSAKKPESAAPDTLKNGLNESDRLALGKFVIAEIAAGHNGEELSGGLKKELERIRAERVKASSSSEAPAKKKKKKKADASV